MHKYIEQVIDLLDPALNRIHNMTLAEARERVLSSQPGAVREIDGSFALLAREGKKVFMARSLDRPMRYFLAKRADGPALVVSDRIDAIREWLSGEKLDDQFHPSYTRMVPAHYITEILLIGCPDPDPTYTRFFNPQRNSLASDLDQIGSLYISGLMAELVKWFRTIPEQAPVGVCFSGGIDSGAVFLAAYHVMRKLGLNLGRLKAFTLTFGDGADLAQAREFLDKLGLGLFLEPIEADLASLDISETIRVIEDYKPLDVEAASMVMTLCRNIRTRYPDWKYLLDGDGGDENLKDYPIEANPELTIRSVVNNTMLYQEGWGVGKIKHSLTYTGGLSRSYTRTYAPAKHFGFEGFSPFTRPGLIEIAEGIPFVNLTQMDHERLYSLKGAIVSRGIKALTGLDMPTFTKRRFQHGALPEKRLRERFPDQEAVYRRQYFSLYP